MGSDTALAQRFALYSFSSDNFFVYLTAWIISAIRDISIILWTKPIIVVSAKEVFFSVLKNANDNNALYKVIEVALILCEVN